MMPRFNGITIAHALVSRKSGIKLVLTSGIVPEEHPFIANAGVDAFLPKPFRLSDVLRLAERLVPAAVAETAVEVAA
jgi:CheY-like chemotaxis protein